MAGLIKLGLYIVSEIDFDHIYEHMPKRLYQLVSKVAMTKQKEVFESQEVIEKFKFFNKDFEQSMAGYLICNIDRPFQSFDVAVLQCWSKAPEGNQVEGSY